MSHTFWRVAFFKIFSAAVFDILIFDDMLFVVISLIVETKSFARNCEILIKVWQPWKNYFNSTCQFLINQDFLECAFFYTPCRYDQLIFLGDFNAGIEDASIENFCSSYNVASMNSNTTYFLQLYKLAATDWRLLTKNWKQKLLHIIITSHSVMIVLGKHRNKFWKFYFKTQ